MSEGRLDNPERASFMHGFRTAPNHPNKAIRFVVQVAGSDRIPVVN
jgi:hypothetical protein